MSVLKLNQITDRCSGPLRVLFPLLFGEPLKVGFQGYSSHDDRHFSERLKRSQAPALANCILAFSEEPVSLFPPMTNKQIRLANLIRLWGEFQVEHLKRTNEEAEKQQFAEHYELNPAHLSQLLGGRGMGDDTARKLERLHVPPLPEGWMDQDHSKATPENEVEQSAVHIFLDLYRKNPAKAHELIRAFIKNNNPKK